MIRRWRLRVLSYLLIVVCLWMAFGALRTLLNPWYSSKASHAVTNSSPTRLFVERPLVLLTLSYHAAPIYDLMDQLQPLGVQFIERGINAYACQYFNTCRRHGPLKVNRIKLPVLTINEICNIVDRLSLAGIPDKERVVWRNMRPSQQVKQQLSKRQNSDRLAADPGFGKEVRPSGYVYKGEGDKVPIGLLLALCSRPNERREGIDGDFSFYRAKNELAFPPLPLEVDPLNVQLGGLVEC